MCPLGKRLLSIASVVFLLIPVTLSAQRLAIEAESYTASNDTGGAQIQSLPLSGCSGGYFLYGLDTPGEWVQYDVALGASGTFSFILKCRGVFDREYGFRLVFTPVDGAEAQTVDFTFVGMGFG
jgi:hypothetical protein